jgi:hypothetical protein
MFPLRTLTFLRADENLRLKLGLPAECR